LVKGGGYGLPPFVFGGYNRRTVSQQESRAKRGITRFVKWFPEALILPLHAIVLLVRFIAKIAH
jgi:hypothetical protein